MNGQALEFRPLAEFALAWRWTSEEYDLLPPAALQDIRPLTESSARSIASEAVSRCSEAPISEFADTYSAEWDERDSVRARLIALPIAAGTRVIVSWHATTAVETSWRTFTEYWDAFCYPSSDDVTVWATGASWSVCYRHFEMIQVRVNAPAIQRGAAADKRIDLRR